MYQQWLQSMEYNLHLINRISCKNALIFNHIYMSCVYDLYRFGIIPFTMHTNYERIFALARFSYMHKWHNWNVINGGFFPAGKIFINKSETSQQHHISTIRLCFSLFLVGFLHLILFVSIFRLIEFQWTKRPQMSKHRHTTLHTPHVLQIHANLMSLDIIQWMQTLSASAWQFSYV